MKNNYLTFFTVLLVSFSLIFFTGCQQGGDEVSEEETIEEVVDEVVEETSDAVVEETTDGVLYACPMNCEGSESAEPGKCPVCEMDLEKVETEDTEEEDVHEGHDH